MKYTAALGAVLTVTWLVWSGHFENPFLLIAGGLSVAAAVALSWRMSIVDDEGVPLELGFRPFFLYAPWLLWEIVVSNVSVAKIILSPRMKLQRNLVTIECHQRTSIGRVIHANSITLTPGTVSVSVEGNQIQVHALSYAGGEHELSGDIDRRVCRLEGSDPKQGKGPA